MVAIFVAGAAVMIWCGIIRLGREDQLDSAAALVVAGILALALIPLFLSLGVEENADSGGDDEAPADLGGRGRAVRLLGLALGACIAYAILREDFSASISVIVAGTALALRGAFTLLLARAERRGGGETAG